VKKREFQAAILEQSRQPLIVDTVTLPAELQAGQVLVKVLYSGICGAQLNEIEAAKGPDKFLPHLLGHEGLGEVLEVGPLVRHVAPGDQVILHWMPGAGFQSDPAAYSWRGQRLNAGWVTTLSELTVVSGNRCTKIESTLAPQHLPLLGCAATTAAGVIGRDAGLRLGESVVVLGTGGVGLLTVEAARASGGYPIVGVDKVEARLEHARRLGARSTVLVEEADVFDDIIRALGGTPPDVVVETTGAREMIELAYQLVSTAGRAVLVGVPRHDEPASFDTLPLHFNTVMTGSKGGGTKPEIDIPRLASLAEANLFRLDALPVTLFPLSDVNAAIDLVRSGMPGRAVIDMTA
jgi:S-(hydroxymethyl)glutathione dehydrogenase/alcohol dehydrogenase